MNTDQLIDRYWRAIVATTQKTQDMINDDAILLALNLAVTEAYDAGASLCHDMAAIIASQTQQTPDQRQAEADRAQMALIAEWLAENEPALYYGEHGGYGDAIIEAVRRRDDQIAELQGEIAKLDADNADLTAKLQNAHLSWRAAQADADRLALRIAQQPDAIHVNGNGTGAVDPTPATASETEWGRSNPVWNGLTAEEREELYAVVNGEKKWRQLTKNFRRDLMQRVLSGLTKGGTVSMSEFDNMRPAWMPTANSLATSLGMKWTDMLNSIPF